MSIIERYSPARSGRTCSTYAECDSATSVRYVTACASVICSSSVRSWATSCSSAPALQEAGGGVRVCCLCARRRGGTATDLSLSLARARAPAPAPSRVDSLFLSSPLPGGAKFALSSGFQPPDQ
eukprot:97459-Chlamydomonas_euryale.AAC.3